MLFLFVSSLWSRFYSYFLRISYIKQWNLIISTFHSSLPTIPFLPHFPLYSAGLRKCNKKAVENLKTRNWESCETVSFRYLRANAIRAFSDYAFCPGSLHETIAYIPVDGQVTQWSPTLIYFSSSENKRTILCLSRGKFKMQINGHSKNK